MHAALVVETTGEVFDDEAFYYSTAFEFPSTKEHAWAEYVERWYQTRCSAFGVTEVYWQNASLKRTAAMDVAL